MICVLLASLIGPTLDRLHFLQGTLKFDGLTDCKLFGYGTI